MEEFREEFFIFNAGSIDCIPFSEEQILKLKEVKQEFYRKYDM